MFLIHLFVLIGVPKDRSVCIAAFRLVLGETGLKVCGTDTALCFSDTCYIKVCVMFLDEQLCRLFLCVLTALVGYGEIGRILNDKLFQPLVAADSETAHFDLTLFIGVIGVAPPLESRFAVRVFR